MPSLCWAVTSQESVAHNRCMSDVCSVATDHNDEQGKNVLLLVVVYVVCIYIYIYLYISIYIDIYTQNARFKFVHTII